LPEIANCIRYSNREVTGGLKHIRQADFMRRQFFSIITPRGTPDSGGGSIGRYAFPHSYCRAGPSAAKWLMGTYFPRSDVRPATHD
jgi:hypothetical protein